MMILQRFDDVPRVAEMYLQHDAGSDFIGLCAPIGDGSGVWGELGGTADSDTIEVDADFIKRLFKMLGDLQWDGKMGRK